MAALSERIAALIAAQGPISVAQYMALALHDSEGGYYATRDPFGRAGDFITAPEISQMFGELLGLWLGQVWMDQGSPKNTHLVELGPGRGTLMADALRALKRVPGFCEQVEIVLVEASPTLRQIQKARLKDSGASFLILRVRARVLYSSIFPQLSFSVLSPESSQGSCTGQSSSRFRWLSSSW